MIDVKNYTILILSCDNYSDAWEPLAKSFELFWPDCPFPIYLCTEEKAFHHSLIKNIQIGKKMNWGRMMCHALRKVAAPNIIYMQEDYLLKGPIKSAAIFDLLEWYERFGASYLRFIPYPPPDKLLKENPEIGSINKNNKYLTSLQTAVWKKEMLQEIILEDDTNDSFERLSYERAQEFNSPFLSVAVNSSETNVNVHSYAFDYFATTIFQGKWLKEAVKKFNAVGIKIDTRQRGVMTRWDFFYYHQMKSAKGIKLHSLNFLNLFLGKLGNI